ncbi:MAG: hypothetical protein HW416_2583 [Chloroflexi bacterium]|nr:hypothetical protein [Chloroflexota bacterium]
MQRWEYKWIIFGHSIGERPTGKTGLFAQKTETVGMWHGHYDSKVAEIDEALAALGAEGWELVAVTLPASYDQWLYLKRPVG